MSVSQDPSWPSRCPRCEGYEATYHTFEGECSLRHSDEDEAPFPAETCPACGRITNNFCSDAFHFRRDQ